MLNRETVLENARNLAKTQADSEAKALPSLPSLPSQIGAMTHEGILNVTEKSSGASWYTMKFKRRNDAESYAKRRNGEETPLCYTLEKKLEDATVKELCEIPGFLKR